jgi:hypothetical protein
VAEVYRQIPVWQQYGAAWSSSPLLRHLAESGAPLGDAKPGRPMWLEARGRGWDGVKGKAAPQKLRRTARLI